MAMKLNPREKLTDSTIRAFNKQIENAFKKLGVEHTVTQNLISTAKSIYGESNIKFKGTSEIPQIMRNRKIVSDELKARALRATTKYTTGSKIGTYKAMYDVTRAYNKAKEQVRQSIIKSLPNEMIKTKTPKQLEKEIKKQITPERVREQIKENDLASEIFEAYKAAKDNKEDTELYEEFAKNYHEGREIDYDLLDQIARRRFETLMEKTKLPEQQLSGITGLQLNDYLGDLNPF